MVCQENKVWDKEEIAEEIKQAAMKGLIRPVESCKYLLPCGICDKTDQMCSQYDSITLHPVYETDKPD